MKCRKALLKKAVVTWLRKHIGIYLLTLAEILNFLTQESSFLVLFYKNVNVRSKDAGRRGCNSVLVLPSYWLGLS